MTGIRIIANLIEHDLSFGPIFILKYASENGHVQADTNNVVNELLCKGLLLYEAYKLYLYAYPCRVYAHARWRACTEGAWN